MSVWTFGVAGCLPMPRTGGDIVDLVRGIMSASAKSGAETVCLMEATGGYVGKAQPCSRSYTFGENAGFIKGVVQTLGIRLELVRPQEWQKAFGLGTASACGSKSIWKNKLKAEAQRRFPHLRITHKTADSLLILDYALMKGMHQ